MVDSKSEVEKTISYSLFSKWLIDYILRVCMCERPIRARVPGKFRHQHLTVDGCGVCEWFMMNILNSGDYHGYCLGETAF